MSKAKQTSKRYGNKKNQLDFIFPENFNEILFIDIKGCFITTRNIQTFLKFAACSTGRLELIRKRLEPWMVRYTPNGRA